MATDGGSGGGRRAQALPRRLGAYELLSVLGEGGMGTVYRARHVMLGVTRAVKTLNARPGKTGAARFAREVDALARVRHDNVVVVHEVGSEGETDYYAMDLVEGRPLDAVLEDGPLALDRALDIAAQAGRGVGALHAAGIVHRDLKPQNVVLRPDGRVVVIDLGLAVAPERDQRLTVTGQLLGTPTYMAPEQVRGERQTPATDVHALGLLLFELVTGRVAFDGDTVHEVVARVVSGERPAPSSIDPALPDALDALVASATALDAARRPADGRAFAAEVERLRAAPGRTARAARGRRRALAAAAAVVAVAGLGAGAGWLAVRGDPPAAVPDEPAPDAATGAVAHVRSPATGHVTWSEAVDVEVVVEVGLVGGAPRSALRVRASRGDAASAVEVPAVPGVVARLRVPLRAGSNEVLVQALRSGAPWGRADHVTIERRSAPPWFHALAPDRRPPRAVDGLVPDAVPGRYRNERDGSLLLWVPPGDTRVNGPGGLERGQLERGLFLGLHEVTNAQVRRFRADWRLRPVDVVGLPLEDDLPAALDWFEAQAYCRWAGLRLPSDLEWVRAASGDAGRRYPWGSEEPGPGQVNAMGSASARQLESVLRHPGDQGPFGHLGLGGNAREWVQQRVASEDERPGEAERIVRGSSASERFESAELGLRRGLPPTPQDDSLAAEETAERALVGLRVAIGPDDGPRAPRDLGWSVRAARSSHIAPESRRELDKALAEGGRLEARLPHLDLRMGPLGPGHVLRARGGGALDPTFPGDSFVIVATCAPVLPAGRWLVVARADDSVRVWIDDALRIDAWTPHGERADAAAFIVDRARPVAVRVEYHEVASTAILAVDLVAD